MALYLYRSYSTCIAIIVKSTTGTMNLLQPRKAFVIFICTVLRHKLRLGGIQCAHSLKLPETSIDS